MILDEPTRGVDTLSGRLIWSFLKNSIATTEPQAGPKSVLLTTHQIEEAESISDYVYIISEGSIRAHGTPSNLKSKLGVGDKIILSKIARTDRENLACEESELPTEGLIEEDGILSRFVNTLNDEVDSDKVEIIKIVEDREYQIVIGLEHRTETSRILEKVETFNEG